MRSGCPAHEAARDNATGLDGGFNLVSDRSIVERLAYCELIWREIFAEGITGRW